jgi:hypothetical protein
MFLAIQVVLSNYSKQMHNLAKNYVIWTYDWASMCSGFSCINKYEYSIKGSIIVSLNLHFEFGLHRRFRKLIIGLI